MSNAEPQFDAASISRPDPSLLTYYIIICACTVFGFPFVILPALFKYYTLKYSFDDKGVSMSYGVLFHKQVYLTYRRIQDIHVTRNFIQRWLGLAQVAVQTASGSSTAEMTIEGIRNPEALRDYLYARMRGARPELEPDPSAPRSTGQVAPADEALELLRGIRDDLRRVRLNRSGERAS